MGYIDLHVHSNMSDGSLTPAELVRYACEKGLVAFALTDHNTVAGIVPAINESRNYPVKVIPGVEVTCAMGNRTLHILGYNVDYTDEVFISRLRRINQNKEERNLKMCSQMRTYGIDIEYENFRKMAGCRNITRNHFAAYLVASGYVDNKAQAFEKYLGKGKPCYIPEKKIPAHDAVRLILSAKGTPVLAHPKQYKLDDNSYIQLFTILKSFGLKGVETIYTTHTHEEELKFTEMAKSLGLFITGGSDFHGFLKPDVDLGTGRGNLMIPQELLNNL